MKMFLGNIEKKANLFIGISVVAVFLFVLTACEPKDSFHGDPVTISFNGQIISSPQVHVLQEAREVATFPKSVATVE